MKHWSSLIISALIFFSPGLHADWCDSFTNVTCEEAPSYFQVDIAICKALKPKLNCQSLVDSGDLPAEKLQTCSPREICRQLTLQAVASPCARALGETLNDYKTMITGAWNSISQRIQDRNELIRAYDQNLSLKRELVSSHPSYSKISDEKLAQLPASFLWIEVQNHEHAVQDARRYAKIHSQPPLSVPPRTNRPLPVTEPGEDRSFLQRERAVLAATADWMTKQGEKLACLSPEALVELKCYGFFMAVDPLLAAKLATKSPWIVKALGKILPERTSLLERRGHLSSEVTTGARTLERQKFINTYETLEYTTEAENKAWIALARERKRRGRLFLDVENSALKALNDTIKDKSLVTALTNFHKEILFEEMAKLQSKYPKLKISPYSDFKSVRLVIDGNMSKEAQQALEEALKTANTRFSQNPSVRGLLREGDLSSTWFRAGISETADQANAAARFGRRRDGFQVENYNSSEIQKHLSESLASSQNLRKELVKDLDETQMIQKVPVKGKEVGVIDRGVFDLVRKIDNDAVLESTLIQQYGLKSIPSGTIQKLRSYAQHLDTFSPGIHIEKRVIVNYDDAAHGGASVDFVGMGPRNTEGTQLAAVEAANTDQMLMLARREEQRITVSMNAEREAVQSTMRGVLGQGADIRTACSGDDCGGMFIGKPIRDSDKVSFVKAIAQQGRPSNYRIAFFPPGVTEGTTRSQLLTHGESLEKLLRKRLAGIMERRRLDGLVFGVDMQTIKPGDGRIRLIVARDPSVSLTATERTNIEISLRHALDELNQELTSAGVASNYRAGPMALP